jgi:hypothetical protein
VRPRLKKKKIKIEAEVGVMYFEDGRGAINQGKQAALEARKGEELDSSQDLQKEPALPVTGLQCIETNLRLLATRTIRE